MCVCIQAFTVFEIKAKELGSIEVLREIQRLLQQDNVSTPEGVRTVVPLTQGTHLSRLLRCLSSMIDVGLASVQQ